MNTDKKALLGGIACILLGIALISLQIYGLGWLGIFFMVVGIFALLGNDPKEDKNKGGA